MLRKGAGAGFIQPGEVKGNLITALRYLMVTAKMPCTQGRTLTGQQDNKSNGCVTSEEILFGFKNGCSHGEEFLPLE